MDAISAAWQLIATHDAALLAIIFLSLKVSLSAVCIAALLGAPLGTALAVWNFPGQRLAVIMTTTFMALPPVVVGLGVYLLLSRAGPLGDFGLLYTPFAMIIAQTLLVLPIVTALTREAVLPLHREYQPMLVSMGAGRWLTVRTLLWDARFGVVTAILAGFGRAIAEVGAVLIVGGNINGVTRVMTTTIALETSKGNLEIALALGLILIGIAFVINALMHFVAVFGRRYQVVA